MLHISTMLTGCFGLNVTGLFVAVSVEPYEIGFFVGFGFGRTDVDLSHGDGRGFVTKLGSVVTCHADVDDQVTRSVKEKINLNLTMNENSNTHESRHSLHPQARWNCR